MNKPTIVIIGGGSKSGAQIAERFRQDDCHVLVLSHQPYDNAISADFTDVYDVLAKFRLLTEAVEHIDMFIYNTNVPTLPNNIEDFQEPMYDSRIEFYRTGWTNAVNSTMLIPHLLTLAALEKMSSTSRCVYFTTYLSYADINQYKLHSEHVAYRGTKSVQNFIMLAFAQHNQAGATFVSLSPHYPYERADLLELAIDRVYTTLNSISAKDNGTIIACY